MLLVVIGTGLMGGSFALAARAEGLFDRVLGIDPDPECQRRAVELGIVDAVVEAVPDDADAILLAGPSHTIATWVRRLASHRGLIFDTGSVKGAVLAEMRAAGAEVPAGFVPCHPLTGSDQSGPAAANAALYRDAQVIVTPAPETNTAASKQVETWWRRIGAWVEVMNADEHDRVLARTSHLPHLLAFAYLQVVDDGQLVHTAGGFRDFTRIGAADARVWAPIFRLNRDALLHALDDLEAELGRARRLLEADDEQGLADFIESSARRRRRLGHEP